LDWRLPDFQSIASPFELNGEPLTLSLGYSKTQGMSNSAIVTGLIVSAILLALIATFGSIIRDWYRSARDKMHSATERPRRSRSNK
jgi:hypothetical protein